MMVDDEELARRCHAFLFALDEAKERRGRAWMGGASSNEALVTCEEDLVRAREQLKSAALRSTPAPPGAEEYVHVDRPQCSPTPVLIGAGETWAAAPHSCATPGCAGQCGVIYTKIE